MFWDLFRESVIVQSVIAFILVGAIVYLALVQAPIPDILVNATMLVLGFYFGSKTQQAITRASKGR
jgi:xanthosine utilization system XapX-like protein